MYKKKRTPTHLLRYGLRRLHQVWGKHGGYNRSLARVVAAEYGAAVAKDIVRHIRRHRLHAATGNPDLRQLALQIKPLSYVSSAKHFDVSIIVPVYNSLHLTLSCLERLLRHQSSSSFDVIIADDNSTDGTSQWLKDFGPQVKVFSNAEAKGFVGNCNHAARQASSQYIVLLNNDTLVLPGWLDNLIAGLKVTDVGLAGSRMIWPNGRLQEAGSVVFRNGRTIRYGETKNPTKDEYNRPRDADFISATSIAMPLKLWRELDGFDTRFAPGYYEDVDLAFRVRSRGYRVLYQPTSTIVHFGSLSFADSKRDLMVANRAKFVEKWAHELNTRPVWPDRHVRGHANLIVEREETRKSVVTSVRAG